MIVYYVDTLSLFTGIFQSTNILVQVLITSCAAFVLNMANRASIICQETCVIHVSGSGYVYLAGIIHNIPLQSGIFPELVAEDHVGTG